MQNIPDKDLDQLFKDKLANAELEPPVFLWNNIEQQIQSKRKRPLPLYWMAAAMAFLAISVGLLFNNKDKIQLHGNSEVVTTGVKPLKEVQKMSATKPVVVPVESAEEVERTEELQKAEQLVTRRQSKNVLIAMQPSAPKVHHKDINATKKQELQVTEMKMEVTPLTPKAALFAQAKPSPAVTEEAIAVQDRVERVGAGNERNGINNIGDLVNLVVEKVDKREKKFLQFKSDDDDNSSLVAINIGIIKFNGKNKAKR